MPHFQALVTTLLGTLLLPSTTHAQCSFAMLMDLDSILPVCCGSTEVDDCSEGLPARCSPECARLLVPFWDECSTMIQLMGGDMVTFDLTQMENFIEPCTQTLLLHTSATTTCGATADVDGWVGDVNTNCCEQGGVNVCSTTSGVPWLCNIECALTFLPFVDYCMPPEDMTPEFTQLQITCASMNSYAPYEVAGLIADVNELVDNPQCHIDTSNIVSADGTGGSSCVDDQDGILAGMRLSCPSDQVACDQLLSQTQAFGVTMADAFAEGTTIADVCPSACLMCPGQQQCIDDDSFIQTAFGNPGTSCAVIAESGLCDSLQESDMDNRCCQSCSNVNGHRMLQQFFPQHFLQAQNVTSCQVSSFFDRAQEISTTCCANADCHHGLPSTCDFACSRVYTPFLQDCGEVMENLGWSTEELQNFENFGNLCTNLDVTSLVMAIHDSTCWFCGDDNQDEDEECDAGQINACDVTPCTNGGTCYTDHETVSGFQCQCIESYEGPTCGIQTNPGLLCGDSENDCDLHATCRHSGPGIHSCECFLGFTGDGHICSEQGVVHCLADCTLERLCPALEPLDRATIEYSNGLVFPTTATYTCDESGGPPINGDVELAELVCQEDGTWAGVEAIHGAQCCIESESPIAEFILEYTGSDQSVSLADVDFGDYLGIRIAVKLWGAGGSKGDDDSATGFAGPGGYVSGVIDQTQYNTDDTFIVVVGAGGQPATTGGYGGAGYHNWRSGHGGAGGGYSGIFRGSVSQANAIVIAGGGGGMGQADRGGSGGGLTAADGRGESGDRNQAYAGHGGTQTSAGADGQTQGNHYAARDGRGGPLQGGGFDGGDYAGAGGGGYFGGGAGGTHGGCPCAGGGGGSSFVGGLDVDFAVENEQGDIGDGGDGYQSEGAHSIRLPANADDSDRGDAGEEERPGKVIIKIYGTCDV
eukprot:COSAG05_NODE_6_length_45604_cov_26.489660_33_plen_929_part_00